MKSKKMLLVYCILLIGVIVLMFNLRPPKTIEISTRDYPEIKTEGILRVITDYDQSGYYIAGDTIKGFQYELSRAIAEISGLEVRILLETNLAESFIALENNVCDIIARNIPVTTEEKENYLFTDPIVMNKQVLVQRTAEANNGIDPIRNQLDLKGKTIYVPQYSPARIRLKNLADEIGDTINVVENELYSSEQLLILVAKGDIDFAVCDQQTSNKYLEEFPELDIDTDISFTQLQAWAVRWDSPILRDSLNSWMEQIREQGIFNLIYQKYY